MEVLARYCSIPGYNKLCCESCSKRSSTLPPPFLPEAAETRDEVIFNPSDLPGSLVMPTSLVPYYSETPAERKKSLSRISSAGGPNAYAALRPNSKPDGANLPQRRAPRAGSKTVRQVSPATRSGHLTSSSQTATAPFLAVHDSTGASSQARTSKKEEKINDNRHPLRSPTLERWKGEPKRLEIRGKPGHAPSPSGAYSLFKVDISIHCQLILPVNGRAKVLVHFLVAFLQFLFGIDSLPEFIGRRHQKILTEGTWLSILVTLYSRKGLERIFCFKKVIVKRRCQRFTP